MLDNLKLSTKDQSIINRLLGVLEQEFVYYKSEGIFYRSFFHSFKHKDFGSKFSLHFQKVFEKNTSGKKILAGYGYVDIVISPHYHFNNYLHNGNDFTPENSVKSVSDILTYLGIEPQEYDLFKVVNIEFGLNIIPETDIKNLINRISYSSRTAFVVPNPKRPYFKITDATKYKQIKAYAKGLQFADNPQFRINLNTFRFEVKSKQGKNILKYGINTVNDLLKDEVYKTLSQEILNEWENVLILNLEPDFSDLKPDEVEFIQMANKKDFWSDLITDLTRKKFGRAKAKYFKILQQKNNLHTQIKGLIIDKLLLWSNVPYSTSETPINIEKPYFEEIPPTLIKVEYGTNENNNRVCLVTNLDISMQRKRSKYLCFAGLKYYREKEIDKYKDLENKYLTDKIRLRDWEEQLYYIAHNIRNAKTNSIHNRKSFELRNYPQNQLQFNF